MPMIKSTKEVKTKTENMGFLRLADKERGTLRVRNSLPDLFRQ